MNAPRVAINGFGRIGRLALRALLEHGAPVEVVAVNDLAPPRVLAHLLEFDSVHGRFGRPVGVEDDALVVDGRRIRVLSERDPAKLPWRDLDVDYVLECTGRFTSRADLEKHLAAGARRVVLSAPGKDVDVTLVRGVNLGMYDPARHRVVSNASCTTNCLAPVLKVLHERFGVEHASMTTVHAYTNDQALLDSPHEDLRRARAAALSIVPTTTGAARAIGSVIPELKGRVDGVAIRVPVTNGSLIDLSVELRQPASKEALADAFREAAGNDLAGILGVEERPLVSSDFNHDPRSAVVDVPGIMHVGPRLVKVLAWYDNEWGYSNRLAELVHDLWGEEDRAAAADASEAQRKGAASGS